MDAVVAGVLEHVEKVRKNVLCVEGQENECKERVAEYPAMVASINTKVAAS